MSAKTPLDMFIKQLTQCVITNRPVSTIPRHVQASDQFSASIKDGKLDAKLDEGVKVRGELGPAHEYAAMYEQLTADIGTPEDITALHWVSHERDPSVLSELLALDEQCAQLARDDAPEAEYRLAVERLVSRVRDVRRLYRDAIRLP